MSSPEHPARTLWRAYEPIHAVTYFAPECLAALADTGLRGFWMGYFASRAAPMGTVSAGVVEATFFNFHPDRVRRAIPDAWSFASPADVLRARRVSAAAALRRSCDATDEIARSTRAHLERVAWAADAPGRPLFAANRELPLPDDPAEALWQLCTILREHRGDGHVAALTAAGLDGCEAHVLFAATEGVEPELYLASRGWSAQDWNAAVQRLQAIGLVDGDGSATTLGRERRDQIERTTDELSWAALSSLTPREIDSLLGALGAVADAVADAGEIPFPNPMGLGPRR